MIRAMNVVKFSPAVTKAAATLVGATNVGRLLDVYYRGSTAYVHPESRGLPGQYKVDRGMDRYFADLPGLEDALSGRGVRTYLDMGAGYGRAAEEIALSDPGLEVIAVSKTDFSKRRKLPSNMTYIVADARDAIEGMEMRPDVTADIYGAFTFDVYDHPNLLSLYMKNLAPMGRAFIRHDADHIGIVDRYGMMMFFSEWINGLCLNNVHAVTGPNPTGPTALVSVIVLFNDMFEFKLPRLELLGIRQFNNDVVPFVVYGLIE